MKGLITSQFYLEACKRADERMKAANGHLLVTVLKTRCMNCGRSLKAKGRCGMWFQTFVEFLRQELCNAPGKAE